jgi:hypothetical protein
MKRAVIILTLWLLFIPAARIHAQDSIPSSQTQKAQVVVKKKQSGFVRVLKKVGNATWKYPLGAALWLVLHAND